MAKKSDELTKSIEHAATIKGININMPVTEEDIKKNLVTTQQ